MDKLVLNSALNYIYSPDYNKEYSIDKESLKRTIKNIEKSKSNRSRSLISSDFTPYITTIYNSIVLDSLTLSDSKIEHINRIFFNKNSKLIRGVDEKNPDVVISDITIESEYSDDRSGWISMINLEITNNSKWRRQEYSTTFKLPKGAYISNYYLDVFGVREFGILSEKKSAMWIYSQIKNRDRKDPGILYYLTGNRIRFNIFPFDSYEVRKTGIEILHREPIEINIDGNSIKLGKEKNNESISSEDVIYLSRDEKSTLDRIKRKPYYHFLVDVSKGSEVNRNNYISSINNLTKDVDYAKVSFIDSYVKTEIIDNNIETIYPEDNYEGGFFLDRGIRNALITSYKEFDNRYPVFIVLTDNISEAIIENDFSDLEITYPDLPYFFRLRDRENFTLHSLDESPLDEIKTVRRSELILPRTVLAYPDSFNPYAYVRDNNEVSIVFKDNKLQIEDIDDSYISALKLDVMWTLHNINPDKTGNSWRELIKASFSSGIMTPVTSYIVVENEAQRKALLRKQRETLRGKESLDLQDEVQEMSEPSLIILIILLSGFILIKRRKRN